MSTEVLHATLHLWISGPGSRFAHETRETLLDQAVAQLGELRSSILLSARCEADQSEEPHRRAEFRHELEQFRRDYRRKIDAIATSFGVDAAMKAKEKVERTIVPPETIPAAASEENLGSREAASDSQL